MRFLCLHGMGTNGDIFAIQTGPLRRALGTEEEYNFYDGEYDVDPPPGLEKIFDGPYKAWYAPEHGAASHKAAKELVEEIIETEGPFDAVIGFSQGAALIATMMLERLEANPFLPDWFRVAIFICGGCPLRVDEMQWSRIDPHALQPKQRIRIPTVHIVGRKDEAYEDSIRLRDVCHPATRFEFDHGGGHEIPRNPRLTEEMVRVIRKGIHKSLGLF